MVYLEGNQEMLSYGLSYNLGGASLLIQHNELNRTWGAADTSDENTEVRLKMAF